MPVNLTRANLDQWKRNLKLQLQQKTQKLNSLHSEVNSLLSGMQNSIDTVTADLQSRKGRPDQLAKYLLQEFNNRSVAIQNLDAEICKLAKQVKELRCKVTAVTKRRRNDPGALKAGHRKPNVPCTVEDSKLPAKQPIMWGFPVSQNQYQTLSVIEAQEPEFSPVQSLEDPRKTRAQRLQASSSGEGQELLQGNDAVNDSPLEIENETTFIPDSLSVSAPDILNSQSGGIVSNLLRTGDLNDALYNIDVKEVICTDEEICNKRISHAGQEWSAGRPGNRPIGASDAARNSETCLGPYATRIVQSPYTGCNPREIEASSRLPRKEDQSISCPAASSSRRPIVAEDRASPATVALHPRRPPYFYGGPDDDVHVWTSIVSRWLEAVQGEPSTQLTYVVSLLRGAAFEWYSSMETRTGCPGDWTTLRHAMLERFGSSIRASKARAALLQMTQGKMTVLEYFDAFESCLAQIDDYDESFYLGKFIFGLRPSILMQVFVQHPATLLEAKGIAEELELTHSMVKTHQKQKKTINATQHSGTQERRSGRLYQSVQRAQMKTCRNQRQKQTDSFRERGCLSAHRGAREVSCADGHGPAAVWRSMLRDLPQGDRAGHVRRQGSVVTIDLEALTRRREQRLSADTTVAAMSMHPPSGRPRATRVYLRNRLLRRDRERRARDRVRERRYVTQLLETLVSPTSGGTESCEGVTTSRLRDWQSIRLKGAIIGEEMGDAAPDAAPKEPHPQLSVVSTEDQSKNPRDEEDGILLVVPARIFGHEVRALIDSGATRNFISPAGVTKCGLTIESHNTFLELGDGKKVLSRGRAVDVPVVTSGYTMKTNLTVSNLLHGVDVVLGMTWLKVADPLIRWSTGHVYIPDSISSFQRIMGQWLDKQVKVGTVKVLSTNEQLESLKQPSETASIEVLKSPAFWALRSTETQNSWRSSRAQGDTVTAKIFEMTHPSFGILKVQKMNNNAALPKRSTDGAAGYDLCASQDCTIPAGGKGLVKTGLSISFPTGLYARIAPRSGLALKKFIDVGAGVVDSDYRGEVGVVLFNHGDQDFEVKMGDRIAQLILEKIDTLPVEEVQGLDGTVRGSGGFGSTGVKSENDTGRNSKEKETNGKNERTGEEKESVVKNETLKGSVRGSRTRTVNKTTTEASSRLSRERQIISVKQLKKLVKKKTPVFLAVVWGQENRKVNAAVKSESIGLTEGKKRDLMKKLGPKKRFLSVEEREEEILSRVDPGVRGKLKELVDEFKNVFPDTLPKGRPPKRDIVHEIRTKEGAKPPSRPPYRLGPAEQDEMEEQVKDLLAQGFIRPSASPYGAPILFVPKKDGRWRMCIDYRALNKQTVRDQFPLPRIDSLLERLGQAKVFTKLDLASGYHQIAMEETSIQKTAFRTNRGHFEFLVMPFGLTNAPATFQRLMNKVFAGNLDKFIAVYLDDILIFSRNLDEHWQHLRWALEQLRKAKLFGRLHKCEFLKDQVDYLGFEVSPRGIQASPDKVRAIIEWPKPKSVHDVRSFLGLASYYRRFVRGFSEMARPLTAMTRAGVEWEWSTAQHQAFNRLKLALTTAPVLKLPDFERQFVVTTDASDAAVGAILEQDFGNGLQPVAFASRKLNNAEMRYSAYERELLGIVWALAQWKHYCQGPHSVII